jgi:uncharacterized protein YwgA
MLKDAAKMVDAYGSSPNAGRVVVTHGSNKTMIKTTIQKTMKVIHSVLSMRRDLFAICFPALNRYEHHRYHPYSYPPN